MGWKAVKDHYRIGHTVQVVEGKGICIGSAYVHNIIVVTKDGTAITGKPLASSLGVGGNDELTRIKAEMDEDPVKLRDLVAAVDTFGPTTTVYTYDRDGAIVEKQAEQVGWPHVTTDGAQQYENTFSTDRAQVVEWARTNAQLRLQFARDNVRVARGKLTECVMERMAAQDALRRLMEDEPPETMWLNHYRCLKGHEWTDTWSCQCDDTCPTCGERDVTPYKSEEVA